jgi:hypothetical protein
MRHAEWHLELIGFFDDHGQPDDSSDVAEVRNPAWTAVVDGDPGPLELEG